MANPYGDVELDARGMRALAHPVRLAILTRLQSDGPSTATRLSESVGASPSVTSWHLRQLAVHGLVRDASDAQARVTTVVSGGGRRCRAGSGSRGSREDDSLEAARALEQVMESVDGRHRRPLAGRGRASSGAAVAAPGRSGQHPDRRHPRRAGADRGGHRAAARALRAAQGRPGGRRTRRGPLGADAALHASRRRPETPEDRPRDRPHDTHTRPLWRDRPVRDVLVRTDRLAARRPDLRAGAAAHRRHDPARQRGEVGVLTAGDLGAQPAVARRRRVGGPPARRSASSSSRTSSRRRRSRPARRARGRVHVDVAAVCGCAGPRRGRRLSQTSYPPFFAPAGPPRPVPRRRTRCSAPRDPGRSSRVLRWVALLIQALTAPVAMVVDAVSFLGSAHMPSAASG